MGPEESESESRAASLLPELKPGRRAEGARWYSFVPSGKGPSARVGQNTLYLPPQEPGSNREKIVVVAGANPNGSFSDSYIIDLDTHLWTAPTWPSLLPRYEHAAFISASQPTRLWVFGGASETGNRNCIQVVDFETETWETPEVLGVPPSPRTYHSSSAVIGDRLYVFGGGDKGADPVQDQQLHIFDSATLTWQQPEVLGQPPAPRHGHAVVTFGNKLLIHGGLAGDTFYDDLFCIDIGDMKWETLSATGSVPGGRAAHAAAIFQDYLYIFGGMDPTGALDTMYRYHIGENHWTQVEFKSPVPPARLDHSMCIIPWRASAGGETAATGDQARKEAAECPDRDRQMGTGCPEDQLVYLCLVFGGMDMKGEIYADCAVTRLE